MVVPAESRTTHVIATVFLNRIGAPPGEQYYAGRARVAARLCPGRPAWDRGPFPRRGDGAWVLSPGEPERRATNRRRRLRDPSRQVLRRPASAPAGHPGAVPENPAGS